jgi:hypothetical protein
MHSDQPNVVFNIVAYMPQMTRIQGVDTAEEQTVQVRCLGWHWLSRPNLNLAQYLLRLLRKTCSEFNPVKCGMTGANVEEIECIPFLLLI